MLTVSRYGRCGACETRYAASLACLEHVAGGGIPTVPSKLARDALWLSPEERPQSQTTMSTPQKVGGEIGDVRANIDVDNLNKYLKGHVPTVSGPVAVKQFKVSICAITTRT